MVNDLTRQPETDPTQIYRYRDGLYAQDLLIVGITWLDLFSWLADQPSGQKEIMEQFGISERPTDVMLTLFLAMGLLERREEVFHATTVAREHLCNASPWFLGPYYESLKERPICSDLLKVLRTGKPANWGSQPAQADWHKAMETESFAEQFTAAMDCRGVYLSQAVAKTVDLTRYRRLLDIAGGSGVYACSLCAHYPSLQAAVFEKPPVDRICQGAVMKRGFSDRVSVLPGDFLRAALPSGYDVHLWSNVMHDWGGETVKQLLINSFSALDPNGIVIIHDAFLNEDKSGPLHVAEYSVMLMHSTEGRCYSVKEMADFLREAGFVDCRFELTAAARSVMVARRPK
jgi:3-hydroxy-5-methyl-1-naphthoate 3-O-methyltransferase